MMDGFFITDTIFDENYQTVQSRTRGLYAAVILQALKDMLKGCPCTKKGDRTGCHPWYQCSQLAEEFLRSDECAAILKFLELSTDIDMLLTRACEAKALLFTARSPRFDSAKLKEAQRIRLRQVSVLG